MKQERESHQYSSKNKVMDPHIIAVVVLAISLLALGLYNLRKAMNEDSLARQSPPEERYQGELVEVPKLSECLLTHSSPEDLRWLYDIGVHRVEVVQTELEYVPCAFNPKDSCGWRSSRSMEVSNSQGDLILGHGDMYYAPELFGVRLEFGEERVRAFVPRAVASPERNFDHFCRNVADIMVGKSINALSWLPKSN